MLQEAFLRSEKFQILIEDLSEDRKDYLRLFFQHEPQFSLARMLYQWLVDEQHQTAFDCDIPLESLVADLWLISPDDPKELLKSHLSKYEKNLGEVLLRIVREQSGQIYEADLDSVLACGLANFLLHNNTFEHFTGLLQKRLALTGNPYQSWKHDLVKTLSEGPRHEDPHFLEAEEDLLEHLRAMLTLHDNDVAYWLAGPLLGLLSIASQTVLAGIIEDQLVRNLCDEYLATFENHVIDDFGFDPELAEPNSAVEVAFFTVATRFLNQSTQDGFAADHLLTLETLYKEVVTLTAWHLAQEGGEYEDDEADFEPDLSHPLTFPISADSKVDWHHLPSQYL